MIERLEGFNSFRPSSGLWGRRNLDDVIEMFPVADPGPGDDVMMRWDQTKQLCGHAGPGRGREGGEVRVFTQAGSYDGARCDHTHDALDDTHDDPQDDPVWLSH